MENETGRSTVVFNISVLSSHFLQIFLFLPCCFNANFDQFWFEKKLVLPRLSMCTELGGSEVALGKAKVGEKETSRAWGAEMPAVAYMSCVFI